VNQIGHNVIILLANQASTNILIILTIKEPVTLIKEKTIKLSTSFRK